MSRLTGMLLSFCLCFVGTLYPQIVINEVMSRNSSTIPDEDDDYPDWFELLNTASYPVDLEGYGLSDQASNLFRWKMPPVEIQGGAHLLVFASGKDRSEPMIWDMLIGQGDSCRFTAGNASIPTFWSVSGFDDSGWQIGPSGFGYGDGDDATEVEAISVFIRKRFEVNDPSDVTRCVFHIDFDDGFVAYLNGRVIARENIDPSIARPAYDVFTTTDHEARLYQGQPLSAYEIMNPGNFLRTGENVLAVQVHNVSTESSDLTAIPFLTVGCINPSQPVRTPPYILGLVMSGLHTNFKLSGDGETLYLTAPDSTLQDSVRFPCLPPDVSYGRLSEGGETWVVLANPTPGEANDPTVSEEIVLNTMVSPTGGFYDNPVTVTLQCDSAAAEIRYTLDGSEPNENSPLYLDPLQISQTTAVRARAFIPGRQPGPIITATYFIQEIQNLPVFSLVTDPPNLWDWETGIYVDGPNAAPDMPHYGANYWMDWEKPVHVEFYEMGGQPAFQLDAGMKIFGGWSRAREQKPVAIFARWKYGAGEIDYPLFPDKPIQTFESFLLRNAGNDWDGAYIRDPFMQALVKDRMDLETMAYRPAVVYLNGEYWGIENIREKQNEHYLASNTGVDSDQIDLLENEGLSSDEVIHGSNENYAELIQYLHDHGARSSENYTYVCSRIDIENFAEYMVAQIYFDNKDWPGNNIKFWRPREAGGKWRWILYDTDFGLNLYNETNYEFNTLEFALEPNGPSWPNPPWSTFLLRSLVLNRTFRDLFINRFADHLNTTFRPERVLAILWAMEEAIAPEIPRHQEKWPGSAPWLESNVAHMEAFAENRPDYMFSFIASQFHLSGQYNLTLTVSDPDRGIIRINSQRLDTFPWTGTYFKNIPIRLTAIPKPGFSFAGWSDSVSTNPRDVNLSSNLSLSAGFEPAADGASRIVINEINYNSDGGYNTKDWLELYNGSETAVDMTGWTFQDEISEHRFVFPAGSVIDSDDYLVLCRDRVAFKLFQKRVDLINGDLDFDFSNGGDALRLFDAFGQFIDSVRYDDAAPWPTEADGEGVTLALRDPTLDNHLPENWAVSAEIGGSPGRKNLLSTGVQKRPDALHTFRLYPNTPNPFNASTQLRFDLPSRASVEIRIFNLIGQTVRILVQDDKPPGSYKILWDGRDQTGKLLASGIYLATLFMHDGGTVHRQTCKMMLIQ